MLVVWLESQCIGHLLLMVVANSKQNLHPVCCRRRRLGVFCANTHWRTYRIVGCCMQVTYIMHTFSGALCSSSAASSSSVIHVTRCTMRRKGWGACQGVSVLLSPSPPILRQLAEWWWCIGGRRWEGARGNDGPKKPKQQQQMKNQMRSGESWLERIFHPPPPPHCLLCRSMAKCTLSERMCCKCRKKAFCGNASFTNLFFSPSLSFSLFILLSVSHSHFRLWYFILIVNFFSTQELLNCQHPLGIRRFTRKTNDRTKLNSVF